MRLAGGTGSIIRALAEQLPAGSTRLNALVVEIARTDEAVSVGFVDANGETWSLDAEAVLLALPPRVMAGTIEFSPAMDEQTLRQWNETPTWMAPHAKFCAVYDEPFWREKGLSGAAQSMVGPLVEIHDATTASGRPALFGFVGVPASRRRQVSEDTVVAASLQQLERLFGPEAIKPRAALYKDWAADPLTATPADQDGGEHPMPTTRPWVPSAWADRILLCGSETSRSEPGYLAGAVEAGERGAQEILAKSNRRATS